MKRSDLIKAIQTIMPGVERTIFISDSIMFQEEWVISMSEDLSIACPLTSGLNCAVRAEELLRVLEKMKGDTVDVSVVNDKLVMSSGRTKLRMNQLPEIELNKFKTDFASLELDKLIWKPVPKGFSEALTLSLFSSGKESRLGKISGVAFRGRDVVCTDNYRVSHYQMEGEISDDLFRLSTASVEKIIHLENKYESVSFRDPWLYLTDKNGMIVSVRMYPAADYPIDKVMGSFEAMKLGADTLTQELPKDLVDSIERVEPMAKASDIDFTTQISITKEGDGLVVKADNRWGEAEDRTGPWEGVLTGTIVASPGFLKKILSITRMFKVSPTKKSMSFKAPNFRYLMLAKVTE